MVGLHPDGGEAELGFALGRRFWGRGVMTVAVLAVVTWSLGPAELRRVWAACDVENAASARVLEKAGLACEGRRPRFAVHPNLGPEPRDCWLYGIRR